MVVFARQNVITDPPFSRMDLISCRNLLIYLESTVQRKAMSTFHYALKPQGFLFLGASESIGSFTELFEPIDKKHKLYVKKAATTLAFHLPMNKERGAAPLHAAPLPMGKPQGMHDGLSRELNAAKAAYREAIRLKPDYTEPLVGIGGALLRLGRAPEAIPYYRQALKLDPNLAEAHNGLGGALATEGHDEEANAEYQEALRLKPDLPTAHLNVALLLMKKGDVADARRHLERALAIDPEYAPAQQALRAIAAGIR